MQNNRDAISKSRRWVIKLGSALLTDNGLGLKHALLNVWIKQIAAMADAGSEFVIVSSGAVAEGITRLGWEKRPQQMHELQAAAAVGQMGLIQAYEAGFQQYGKHTAQILLTHDDIADRERYLNARTSLHTLLELGVVPIINENDTVATDEIRFGDNDTLAGLVANLIDADTLVILTDQAGLFNSDPRKNSDARIIPYADVNDPALKEYAGEGGSLGRGGMRTKVKAAAIAARSGTQTIIASGMESDVLVRLSKGEELGTLLCGKDESLNSRKQWLASHGYVKGEVIIDEGAVKALLNNGKSLLPVGIKEVKGSFGRGEVVSCMNQSDKEIARGLANYSAEQLRQVIGKSTQEISEILGEVVDDEFIHRDNLVLS